MSEKWPKITLDTTIEELKAIHNRIWDECIVAYEGRCKPATPYHSSCVACEVALLRFKKNGLFICYNCPMFDVDSTCGLFDSLFERWLCAANPIERKILAQQIRDYKWREDNEG